MASIHSFIPITPLSFLERSALAFPTKIAAATMTEAYSYKDLLMQVHLMVHVIRTLGGGPGDNIGLLSCNNCQSLIAHYGIPATGGAIVSLNPWLRASNLLDQITFGDVRMLFISYRWFVEKQELIDEIRGRVTIVILDAPDDFQEDDIQNYKHLCKLDKNNIDFQLPLDKVVHCETMPIAINFTSGTTGQPKGVVVSHRAAYLHALGQIIMLNIKSDSVYYWSLPMFHVNGWGHMWAVVGIGAKQYINENNLGTPNHSLLSILKEQKISHMSGSPRLLKELLCKMPPEANFEGMTIMTGGASPAPDLVEAMEQVNANLIHQYGLNETCGPFLVCEKRQEWNQLPLPEKMGRCIRQGVPAVHAGSRVRVVDNAGMDVPHDGATLGEIVVAGNTLATEYYKNPEATKKSFIEGWFYTGDVAVIHDDGYIQIKDRCNDLIHVNTEYGWENVSSLDIERTLMEHIGVYDAAVIGVELSPGNHEIIAFYETKKNAHINTTELTKLCKKNLSDYMIPRVFIEKSLPKTATGKVQKKWLRDYITKSFDI